MYSVLMMEALVKIAMNGKKAALIFINTTTPSNKTARPISSPAVMI